MLQLHYFRSLDIIRLEIKHLNLVKEKTILYILISKNYEIVCNFNEQFTQLDFKSINCAKLHNEIKKMNKARELT